MRGPLASIALLAPLLVAIAASRAGAVPIAVDPGSFAGGWGVEGVQAAAPGARTVELAPGSHRVTVAALGGFQIEVAADGTVTVANGVSGTGGAGLLSFANAPVSVDPGAFDGTWSVVGVATPRSGRADVVVVPGVGYFFAAGGVGVFAVTIGAGGAVRVDNGVSGVGGLGTLLLHTTPVRIDPAAFAGEWGLAGVTGFVTGDRTFDLVPGVRYFLFVGGVGAFDVILDGDTDVVVRNGASAVGGPGTLTFNTIRVQVDPGAFTGRWAVSRVPVDGAFGFTTGPGEVVLVPQATTTTAPMYLFVAGAEGQFGVDVAADGTVSAANGVSADGGPGSLRFRTTPVTVDYSGSWRVFFVNEFTSGPGTLDLVPGARYVLQTGISPDVLFTVADPCALSPGTVQVTSTSSLSLRCGPRDEDGDGVTDEVDACPGTPAGATTGEDGCDADQRIDSSCRPEEFPNFGQYMACVGQMATEAVADGLLDASNRGQAVSARARQHSPRRR